VQFSDKKNQLLTLLADGEFHSGTELSELILISRSAVWKQINSLSEQGIEISAVNGKGYRLSQPLELLDQNFIIRSLEAATQAWITSLEVHQHIESTNSYLVALTHADPSASGVLCMAEQQTAGRGRRGRQWVSPFGQNIYLSLLWKFQEGSASLSGLSLAIGVAVIQALKLRGIKEVGLKWPNDIYWRQKKLGGILVEVSGESNGPCSAVIGLGLNLYLPKGEAQSIEQDWVDIFQILGAEHRISRNQLLITLIEQMVDVTASYTEKSFAKYCDQWRQYDCMQAQQVNLFMGNQKIEGLVRGINDEGLLLLETSDGIIHSYASGEVSFRGL